MKTPDIPRRDLLILAGGLVFLLVLAFFIKPIIPSQGTVPPGPPLSDGTLSVPNPGSPAPGHMDSSGTETHGPVTTSPAFTTPLPSPSPSPHVYIGMPAFTLPFVDPATFNITLEHEGPERSLPAYPEGNITQMVTYAEIEGKASGVSGSFHVPVPYWEIWFTVEPNSYYVGEVGEPREQSVAEVHGSVWWPGFSIDVYEVATPHHLIQTLTPDGGLDADLWTNETYDPRPWKAKFFSGESDYFLVIHARNLNSYRVSVMLPAEMNIASPTPVTPIVPMEEEIPYDVG